ncbi:MAG: universal stress protein [Myxococcales bacterium]|nr:universal stress protein [Myxococcales bacterium]
MYKHVLAAIDVVEDVQPALDEALRLCVAAGARLAVVHVVTPYQYPSQWMGPALQLLPQYREQVAAWMSNTEKQVRALVETQQQVVGYAGEIEVIVRQGPAADGIADCVAQGHYDLLVMAAHARRGLGRALLGSVTDAILRRVEIPVLVVRARAKHA